MCRVCSISEAHPQYPERLLMDGKSRSTEGLEFRRTGHHLAVEIGSDSKPSVSP